MAAFLLRLLGWKVLISEPVPAKAVVIVYPHTSNWDFVFGILARFAARMRLQFVGKDSLFRFPFGALFRALGGIPVDRSAAHGLVGQLAGEFERRPRLLLAIAPEGTRSHTDHLKSGFYVLAVRAGVAVGLGYIDYATRTVGIGEWLKLSGDREQDLARLRAFYAGKRGLRAGQASDIRFRDVP